MATRTRVSLEEFLAMPETEPPSELWDGEVVQKVAPSWNHATLTSYIIGELRTYLARSGEGQVVNELRHVERTEERVYLPHVSVMLAGRRPADPEERRQGPVESQPDIAIEILSPGDSAGRTLQRADFYLRVGVSLAWFIDPETRTLTAYRPGMQPTVHTEPETVDAKPVLADFTLDLAAMFAEMDA